MSALDPRMLRLYELFCDEATFLEAMADHQAEVEAGVAEPIVYFRYFHEEPEIQAEPFETWLLQNEKWLAIAEGEA